MVHPVGETLHAAALHATSNGRITRADSRPDCQPASTLDIHPSRDLPLMAVGSTHPRPRLMFSTEIEFEREMQFIYPRIC